MLLRTWKSVCSLIIGSDSEIEGLVNAPATMLNDKLRSQHGNHTKKARKERIEKDLEAAKEDLAQARAQTASMSACQHRLNQLELFVTLDPQTPQM